MNKYLIMLLALTLSNLCNAQISIKGNITDAGGQPLFNCSIVLLAAKDSLLAKSGLSNKDGNFSIDLNTAGNYLLLISHTGYTALSKAVAVSENKVQNIGNIILQKQAQQLQEVAITAKKPFLEQQIDRTVVNVKSSITNIGGTVLEVLEKSPGIRVDHSTNTLNMSGKSGVRVMINGKLSYLSDAALIDMLRGIQAAAVDKIELITTPPARYDAEGNAGYINIILNQTPDEGFNGNYYITAGAFKGTSPAAGIDLNWRKRKLNIYGSIGASRHAQKQTINSYRSIVYRGTETKTFINSERDPYQLNFNARLGMDIQLTPGTVIGFLASGYNNKWGMTADNVSETYNNHQLDSLLKIGNSEINHWKNQMVNVNFQHKLKNNSTLTFNADYLHYGNINPIDYDNNYYSGQGDFVKKTITRSSKETNINILPLQLDYTFNIKNSQWETGIKSVQSSFSNDVFVGESVQNTWHANEEFTGIYYLKENIQAAYISATFPLNPKNQFKAGLRYEHTKTDLDSDTKQNIVNRNYGNFFPNIFWSHSINDNNKINFSYSKRITRPTFNNLAPFMIFADPNTFLSGNANLKPAITDGVKLDYMYKGYSIAAGYSYEKNSIGDFQVEVKPSENKVYQTAQNLDFLKTTNVTINLPVAITSYWFFFITASGSYQQGRASYTGREQNMHLFNWSIAGAQNFTLPEKFSVELSGFYTSKSLAGISMMKPFGKLSIAVQKKFNNSSLKFMADDVFSTMVFRISADDPAINFYGTTDLRMLKRIFKLTYTASFGNKILKQKRDRITASEEERKRVSE
ncbi:MAG: outer membrane beta-barrel family protein [Agriterribacter sp.]